MKLKSTLLTPTTEGRPPLMSIPSISESLLQTPTIETPISLAPTPNRSAATTSKLAVETTSPLNLSKQLSPAPSPKAPNSVASTTSVDTDYSTNTLAVTTIDDRRLSTSPIPTSSAMSPGITSLSPAAQMTDIPVSLNDIIINTNVAKVSPVAPNIKPKTISPLIAQAILQPIAAAQMPPASTVHQRIAVVGSQQPGAVPCQSIVICSSKPVTSKETDALSLVKQVR